MSHNGQHLMILEISGLFPVCSSINIMEVCECDPLVVLVGGNWQPWPPTATSAGPSSLPMADAAEHLAFLLPIIRAPAAILCTLWISVRFIFNSLQVDAHHWPNDPAHDSSRHLKTLLSYGYLNVFFLPPFKKKHNNPISPLIITNV